MSLDTQGRGGARPGAGRPKKKARDLQKTHSIRATDRDWKLINIASRIIKASNFPHDPQVLILSKEDHAKVTRMFMDELSEKRHADMSAPTPALVVQPPRIEPQKPKTLDEEEAVSIFLEYYRMNPLEASDMVRAKLDKEKRIRKHREERSKLRSAMAENEASLDSSFDKIDDINRRIAEMLKF